MGIVSSQSWNGLRIALADRCVLSNNHLPANKEVVIREEVVVGDDGLFIAHFGDPDGPAMRAPDDGVVTVQPWVKVGWHSWRGINWPWLFFTDVTNLEVQARISDQLVEVLQPKKSALTTRKTKSQEGELTTSDSDSANSAGARLPIELLLAKLPPPKLSFRKVTGETLTGSIKHIGSQPVHWSAEPVSWWSRDDEDPRDLLARDFVAKPDPDQVPLIHGERIEITCSIGIPEGVRAIPNHQLIDAGNPPVVMSNGRSQTLHGLRFGAYFLTATELADDWFVDAELAERSQRHQGHCSKSYHGGGEQWLRTYSAQSH